LLAASMQRRRGKGERMYGHAEGCEEGNPDGEEANWGTHGGGKVNKTWVQWFIKGSNLETD
jgi:hypothetical protein